MLLIFTFSSIPNLELEGELSVFDFLLRKLAHLAEYGILFLLLHRALNSWKKAAVIAIAYGISDEIHQLFVPTRDGKVVDILIDAFGVGWGFLSLNLAKKLKTAYNLGRGRKREKENSIPATGGSGHGTY